MLEAVIATGIIVTAVSSALTLVSSSINAEKESESSIIGGNLAREGVEVVRAIRDSNWLSGAAWDQGLFGPANDYTAIPVFDPEANAWSFDFSADLITNPVARVYRYATGSGNATVGLFVSAPSQPTDTVRTLFNRLVTLDPICDVDGEAYAIVTSGSDCGGNAKIGIRATSRVQWTAGGRTRGITLEERLFDWR